MEFIITYGLGLAAVLLIASLSGMMCEKAGVVNIGIEGMMTIGALASSIAGTFLNPNFDNNDSQYLAALVGLLAGGLFSVLHAIPSIKLKANQVVSGTAINLLASGLALFIVTSKIFGTSASNIATGYQAINFFNYLPVWLVVALIITVVLFVFLKYTKQGMRYAMVGENPNAIDAAGINVNKYRYIAVIISGCLAGLAGSIFVLTVSTGNFNGSTMGWGFLAMGIMIFGQWKIHYILIGAILFSALFAIGNQITIVIDKGWLKDNYIILRTIPFILTLLTMIIFSKKSKAPAADGIPFDKSKR